MSVNAQKELDSIISELQVIIKTLESVATGIERDFSGIGSEKCASCISNVARKYRNVKHQLESVDVKKVKKETSGGGSF